MIFLKKLVARQAFFIFPMEEMKDRLHIVNFDTPLGEMTCGTFQEELVLLEFKKLASVQTDQLKTELQTTEVNSPSDLSAEVKRQMHEYFDRERSQFDIPMKFVGTDFQMTTWRNLGDIPYGKTISYQQQAIQHGDLKAIRAIAKANGENRIAIIVPCHRVIGSNGELTGYAGELWRKRALLELEGAIGEQKSLF